MALTGGLSGTFNRSYESLRQYVKWYEWGGKTITGIVTRPGRIGADESPLLKVLKDPLHTEYVHLSKEDQLCLQIWLDANAPFYGTYEQEPQLAQRSGQAVPPPLVQ
ncbi:MAG: hypothetical protein U9Q07_15495 [Planctomycetota bacterium]|nr:hypothetical protein [Planctomycetota bacterium]